MVKLRNSPTESRCYEWVDSANHSVAGKRGSPSKASSFFFEQLGNGRRPERKQVAQKKFYFLNAKRKATTDIGKTFLETRQVYLGNLRRFLAGFFQFGAKIFELKFACCLKTKHWFSLFFFQVKVQTKVQRTPRHF